MFRGSPTINRSRYFVQLRLELKDEGPSVISRKKFVTHLYIPMGGKGLMKVVFLVDDLSMTIVGWVMVGKTYQRVSRLSVYV